MIRYSSLPDINTEHESREVADANAGKTAVFQFPQLMLGALAIFLHIGTQIISIDTIISYANSMSIGLLEARVFPAYTLGATITGYLLGIILIPRYISQLNVLRICTLLGSTLTLLIVFADAEVKFLGHTANISIWFLAMLGIANSLVWPGIWPLALDGLGKYTKVGASILIMGLIANAIMPLVYGHFADVYGNRQAYWVLFPCYLFLVFYAFRGYRLRRWKK
jgi:fucose permease